MNDFIALEPLTLPVPLLMLAVSGAAGYCALAYRLKTIEPAQHSKSILDFLFNTLIIALLIWKFSPICAARECS